MAVKPAGICVGPDGNIWFTGSASNEIGRLSLEGELTRFRIPRRGSPADIVTGPDGNLWFSWQSAGNVSAAALGRLELDGEVTLFLMPNVGEARLTTTNDGAIWFTTGAESVGRFDPATWNLQSFRLTALVGLSFAMGITARAQGGVWFSEYLVNAVGLI